MYSKMIKMGYKQDTCQPFPTQAGSDFLGSSDFKEGQSHNKVGQFVLVGLTAEMYISENLRI